MKNHTCDRAEADPDLGTHLPQRKTTCARSASIAARKHQCVCVCVCVCVRVCVLLCVYPYL